MEQQPLLEVLDTSGNPLAGATAKIIKETSDEFRVNAPEPQDPTDDSTQFYDQSNPQVAMDADGDFVITWQSQVPSALNPTTPDTDIFARRFSAAGFVTGVTQDIQFTTAPTGTSTDFFTLTAEKGTTTAINFDSANRLPRTFRPRSASWVTTPRRWPSCRARVRLMTCA